MIMDVYGDHVKVVYTGYGTADYVEYTEAFQDKLVDSYNPVCVHTHILQAPIPSLSDLVTWCSNEDITRTAIFSIFMEDDLEYYSSAMLFEKNEEYIPPDEVYDVWQKHIKDAVSLNQVFRNILKDLNITVVEEKEFLL